jgi:hypothetical protein
MDNGRPVTLLTASATCAASMFPVSAVTGAAQRPVQMGTASAASGHAGARGG